MPSALDKVKATRHIFRKSLPGGLAGVARRAHPRDARGGRIGGRGEIAQLVEHSTENRGVGGSSPPLAILRSSRLALASSPLARPYIHGGLRATAIAPRAQRRTPTRGGPPPLRARVRRLCTRPADLGGSTRAASAGRSSCRNPQATTPTRTVGARGRHDSSARRVSISCRPYLPVRWRPGPASEALTTRRCRTHAMR